MIAYYLAVSLLHLRFSLFLDQPLPGVFGNIRPISLVDPLLIVLLALLILAILYQMVKYPWRWGIVFFWGIWIFSAVMVDRFLLFKSVEYIHYPQYAIVAALLIWCLDPEFKKVYVGRVLFWATVLGILDELYQYVHLAKTYGDYLDFNDFFLNLQGAAAGVMLVYGFAGKSAKDREEQNGKKLFSARRVLQGIGASIELRFILAVLVIVLLLGVSGSVRLSPETDVPPGGIASLDGRKVFYLERKPGMMGGWNGGIHRPLYYVLSPMEGGMLLLGTWLVFTCFGVVRRRYQSFGLGYLGTECFFRPHFLQGADSDAGISRFEREENHEDNRSSVRHHHTADAGHEAGNGRGGGGG